MTTEHIISFFQRQPFIPFTMVLADGRELHLQHPELGTVGRYGVVVYFFHPTQQVEVVDTSLIVSIRTIYAARIDALTDASGGGDDGGTNDEGE